MKGEIRKDYIQDKYVIIAPRRGKRPHNTLQPPSHKPKKIICVFCPERVNPVKDCLTIGSRKKWKVKVIKNIFPAVNEKFPKAYGRQEVVIESSDHIKELEDLTISHIAQIISAYQKRTVDIMKDPRIQYILIFKNNGGKAGASLQHAHSQIFATEFLPPHLLDKSQKTQAYKLKHGSCVYCDAIKKEQNGPRLIYKDKNIIAFCPYASIYNYEAWIMPTRHIDNVTVLNRFEKKSFAKILKKILQKIGGLGLPYNFYFHQVVNDEDQHLYMKITPRGSVWAGVEIGSGLIINPILPKDAAEYYRKEDKPK